MRPWTALALLATIAVMAAACKGDEKAEELAQEQEQVDQILVEGRQHPDPYVRAETVRMLSWSQRSLWETDVQAMLDDPDPLVVLAAVEALLRDGSNERAASVLEARVRTGTAREQLAALALANRHLDFEPRREVIGYALSSTDEAVQLAAARSLVSILEDGDAPSPAEERELEKQLSVLTTARSLPVAVTAIRHLDTIDRYSEENRARRRTLLKIATEGSEDEQLRAFQILIQIDEDGVALPASTVWANSSKEPESDPLAAAALVGMASAGNDERVELLETLTFKGNETWGRLALTVFVRDLPGESERIVARALAAESDSDKRYLLDLLAKRDQPFPVPDTLLRDPDIRNRVSALKVLWSNGEGEFARTVGQKLAVERFRKPILEGLAAWVRELDLREDSVAPPWLDALSASLDEVQELYGTDDEIGYPLYTLLVYRDGVRAYLDNIRSITSTGQFAVLEAAVRLGLADQQAVDAYRSTLESSLFAVRLSAAVGLSRLYDQ